MRNFSKILLVTTILIGLSIFCWFIYALITNGYIGSENSFTALNIKDASDIGQFIGGFVGFFTTIAGIILLYETIKLQREEFHANRIAFQTQGFENPFFKLFDNQTKILENINHSETDYSSGYAITYNGKGAAVFEKIKKDIKEVYDVLYGFYLNRNNDEALPNSYELIDKWDRSFNIGEYGSERGKNKALIFKEHYNKIDDHEF